MYLQMIFFYLNDALEVLLIHKSYQSLLPAAGPAICGQDAEGLWQDSVQDPVPARLQGN